MRTNRQSMRDKDAVHCMSGWHRVSSVVIWSVVEVSLLERWFLQCQLTLEILKKAALQEGQSDRAPSTIAPAAVYEEGPGLHTILHFSTLVLHNKLKPFSLRLFTIFFKARTALRLTTWLLNDIVGWKDNVRVRTQMKRIITNVMMTMMIMSHRLRLKLNADLLDQFGIAYLRTHLLRVGTIQICTTVRAAPSNLTLRTNHHVEWIIQIRIWRSVTHAFGTSKWWNAAFNRCRQCWPLAPCNLWYVVTWWIKFHNDNEINTVLRSYRYEPFWTFIECIQLLNTVSSRLFRDNR